MDPEVYRAPMRSRVDDVDGGEAVEWALDRGVVGVGARGGVAEQSRLDARRQRFAEVAEGSFVWTRDVDGQLFLGRIAGALRQEPDGEPHDLVHVRACEWHPRPVPAEFVPAAVAVAFARGGRNFQQVNTAGVEQQTARAWELLDPST